MVEARRVRWAGGVGERAEGAKEVTEQPPVWEEEGTGEWKGDAARGVEQEWCRAAGEGAVSSLPVLSSVGRQKPAEPRQCWEGGRGWVVSLEGEPPPVLAQMGRQKPVVAAPSAQGGASLSRTDGW